MTGGVAPREKYIANLLKVPYWNKFINDTQCYYAMKQKNLFFFNEFYHLAYSRKKEFYHLGFG